MTATNFYCGDDAEAKRRVAKLTSDIGFEPIDAGCSRTIGTRDLAFKVLRRSTQ